MPLDVAPVLSALAFVVLYLTFGTHHRVRKQLRDLGRRAEAEHHLHVIESMIERQHHGRRHHG